MKWGARAALVAALVISAAALSLIALVVVSSHGGYRAVSMDTGSMAPMIKPGDLAVIKKTAVDDIRPGDVITFQAPIENRPIVTHRVVSVTHNGGVITIQTKGDANQSPDPWTVQYAGTTGWKVVHVLHGFGSALTFLHGGGGHLVVGLLIFFVTLAILAGGRAPAAPEKVPA